MGSSMWILECGELIINFESMKNIILWVLATEACICYLTMAGSQPSVHVGSMNLQSLGCSTNNLTTCNQTAYIYQVNTTLTIYPNNSIYLAPTSLNLALNSQFSSTKAPHYYFTYSYTPGSSYLVIMASYSAAFSLYQCTLTYIAVEKSYPLYFRAF